MTASAGTVVVLGASGRLGPAVTAALERSGRRVLRAGRRGELAGVDVRDETWQAADGWRSALDRIGVPAASIGAVVNLVAGREHTPDEAASTGRAAIRTAAALCATAGDAAGVHVGSIAEQQPGQLTAYAAGKVAARAEAKACRLGVVLTLGVVPRPAGDPADASLRRAAGLVPAIGAVTLDTSTAEQVGQAIVRVVGFDWRSLRIAPPAEVTLSGRTRTLADVLMVRPAPRWYSPLLYRALLLAPKAGNARRARVISFARRAGRTGSGHYDTAPAAAATPVADVGGWPLVGDGGRLWLVPPKEDPR